MSRRQPTVPLRALVIISFVALAVLLLASAGFASGGDMIPPEVAQPEVAQRTAEYEVRHGDSLWSIAAAHTRQGGDVRATVADLRHLNTLSGSLIHPGQVLHLPPSAG